MPEFRGVYVMRTSDGACLLADSIDALGSAIVQLGNERAEVGVVFEHWPLPMETVVQMSEMGPGFDDDEVVELHQAMDKESRRLAEL